MLSSDTTRVRHYGNGVATTFSIPFKFFANADIKVTRYDVATDTPVVLVAGAYSITGAGAEDGGTLTYTMNDLPLSASYYLIIQRELDYTQDLDIARERAFLPDALENQLDRIVMQIQQLRQVVLDAVTDGTLEQIYSIISEGTMVVDSMTELRALDASFTGTDIYLRGYYTGSRTGNGRFTIDPDDTTSADDDGTVIVLADNRRAKRTDILGGFLELDFGVRADYSADDQPQLQKALDWLSACPANEQRNLYGSPGRRKLLSGVSCSVANKAYVTWTAPVGRQSIYSIETTDPGIEFLRQGSRARVYLNAICSVPGIAGAGTLLRAKGDGVFSVGGVPFPTVKITNCSCNPENDESSTAYSINPFDIEQNSRPVFADNEYRPGKLAERVLGDYLINLSNCYAFEVHNNTLGGFAEVGMNCIHTLNVEGGALSGNRTTQCNTGFKWQSATPQPGLTIGHNHFNSNECNYDIDGVKLMTMSGGLLFANNGPTYQYTRNGNILTCVADEGQSTHNLVSPFQVRVWFDPEYVDPDYDGDGDGTGDPSPAGIYEATVSNDSQFTIEDPLFGGLDAEGTMRVRWSTSTFSDIRLRNAVNCTIENVSFGGQAPRERTHLYLSTDGSVAGSPSLQGNEVSGLRLTARSNLAPIAVGAGVKSLTIRQSAIWAQNLGTVSYPTTDLVTYEDTSAEVVSVIDSAESFAERSSGGLINIIPNSKFKRGDFFWDTGAGWSMTTSETDALFDKSYAIYVAPDTSNNNLTTKTTIPCEPGASIMLEWVYRGVSGMFTEHRGRATFYDSAGVIIGSTQFGETDVTMPADWTKRNASFVAPANAATVVLGLQVAAAIGNELHVARITAVQSTSLALTEGTRGGVRVFDGGASIWPITDVRAWGAVGSGDETAVIEAVEASQASHIDLAGLTITTTLLKEDIVKKYGNGRLICVDADDNQHVVPNRSNIFDSELARSSTQTPMLDFAGKTVLSLGTSIQAEGSGSDTSYPQLAVKMLGGTCVSMAWAGTSAAYDKAGSHTEIGTVKRLSMTQDDVDWGIATWGDVDTNVYSDLYPGINKASKMHMGYRVVDQIGIHAPALVILEHNRNDMDRSPGVLENESRAINSVSLGTTTTFTLASSGLVAVGDGVRFVVDGIAKLNNHVARVQAVSGAQITISLNSSAFTGSFVSGTCYKVDREFFCEGLGAIVSQIKWGAAYHGVAEPKILLVSSVSEYDTGSFDYRVRSNAQYVRDVAAYWDTAFFDLTASLGIDELHNSVFLADDIHPTEETARQAIANHLAAFLAGGKLPALRKEEVLLRGQTADFTDGTLVVWDKFAEGFVERDWIIDTVATEHSDDFSGGLGGYTLTGTSPTVETAPWDAGVDALTCTHDGVSGTSYIQKLSLTMGDYIKVSFKVYLETTSGLTSADTTGVMSIMNLRTASVHHAVQLVLKETSATLRGYVIPSGASPATVVVRGKPLQDATVHEVSYEIVRGSGSRQGTVIVTVDGERISIPLTYDDSSKSTPDRVFLGIVSNTGDQPVEIMFTDLLIESADVLTLPTGTFTTVDSKTVTVNKGRITKIV